MFIYSFIAFLCLLLHSCHYPHQELNSKDLQTLTEAPAQEKPKKKRKKLSFKKEDILFQKLVSLSLSESIPLKQAIFELAQQAGINLQMDPSIDKKVVYSAKQKPLIEIIADLCELASLRYRIEGRTLKIETDTPYPVNYNVQFLNVARTTQNRVSIATDVFSNVKNNTSTGDNGSNSSITMAGNNDFWQELDNTLKTILSSSTSQATFAIHRQGGLISVFATSKQHKQVESYLKHLRRAVSTQVLIEAKIIEVSLSEQYRSGINWQKIAGGNLRINGRFGDLSQSSQTLNSTQTQLVSFGLAGTTFSSILQAIETFGRSKTLSSPRLTVMNNQTAILKVAQNQVYFRLNYDRSFYANNNRENINVSSDIQTVPIGLVMSVQPSIDQENQEIILSLRPTISRLTQNVRDPAVDIAFGNITNANIQPVSSSVPVVEVREIDSVLRLKDGEIAILGGLMEIRSRYNDSSLPLINKVPLLGEIFKGTNDSDELIELVILLRATILEETNSIDKADQRLYEEYVSDPRPFPLTQN